MSEYVSQWVSGKLTLRFSHSPTHSLSHSRFQQTPHSAFCIRIIRQLHYTINSLHKAPDVQDVNLVFVRA